MGILKKDRSCWNLKPNNIIKGLERNSDGIFSPNILHTIVLSRGEGEFLVRGGICVYSWKVLFIGGVDYFEINCRGAKKSPDKAQVIFYLKKANNMS